MCQQIAFPMSFSTDTFDYPELIITMLEAIVF